MKSRRIQAPWVVLSLLLFTLALAIPTIYAELIPDGSFENNPTEWEEFFSNACNPSGIGNWSNIDGAPDNFDGQQSLWVGGLCQTPTITLIRNNGARQDLQLAANTSLLSFWYNPIKGTPDPLNLDRAVVTMNGEEIWTLGVDGINNPTGWNNAIVDISRFADQTVSLSLAIEQNVDPSIANVFFDAIETLHPEVTITQVMSPTAVLAGTPFTLETIITNSGDTLLENLTVSNSLFSQCNQELGNIPSLPPGETTRFTCQLTSGAASDANTATVQGTTTAIEYPVEASQTIAVTIVNPLLKLEITPDSATLEPGEAVTFSIALTNDSSTALNDVVLSSEPETGCNLLVETLNAGQKAVFSCTLTPNQSGIILFSANGVETQTNSVITTTTAVSIEISPVVPPSVPGYQTYLPMTLNRYFSHTPLGETNNNCNQAFPVELNQANQFLAEDIHDWYQFSLPTAGDLTIQLTNFTPIAGQITLWQGTCNNLTLLGQNGDFATTKTISSKNLPAGNYYIWLINDGSTNNKDLYSLTVTTP